MNNHSLISLVLLFIFGLLIPPFLEAQGQLKDIKVRKEIQKVANHFSEKEGIGRLEDRKHGFLPWIFSGLKKGIFFPKNDRLFKRLEKEATDSELIALCYHPKPIVRLISFCEIIEYREKVDWRPIFLEHLHDNDTVQTFIPDRVGDAYMGQFKWIFGDHHWDHLEKIKVDSLLLYDKESKLRLVNHAVLHFAKDSLHYPRIRELAQSGQRASACFAIAGYKKQSDIPLILYYLKSRKSSDLEYALKAVSIFPDKAFKSELIALYQDFIDEKLEDQFYEFRASLFTALFQYQDEEILNLLTNLINSFDKYDEKNGKRYYSLKYHTPIHSLILAFNKHPIPFFEEVYQAAYQRNEILNLREK